MKYKDYEDIPRHVFSNKECTKTPSPELLDYLRYMVENHEQDLAYLWRHSQKYSKHGGCYPLSWEKWIHKLKNDLSKQ